MADENNAGVAAESVLTETAPVVKKTRGPNRKKVAPEAVATAAENTVTETPVKKTRAKRGEKAAVTKLVKAAKAEKATTASRSPAVSKIAVASATSAPVLAAASDEFADLLRLEEENMALRKQLGDKLRTENADLKKRLGTA